METKKKKRKRNLKSMKKKKARCVTCVFGIPPSFLYPATVVSIPAIAHINFSVIDVGAKMEGGHQVCCTADCWGWLGHIVF